MTVHGVNYRATLFPFKDLTPIRGEPNADSLLELTNELKANARSVLSNLGGGAHGHLGLVLSPNDYATVSAIPFVKPAHPGPLVIPPNTTNHRSNTLQDEHNEQMRVFRETQGVEQALLQQIVETIDSQYLLALRNRQTNSITRPIHEVLDHLITTYGRITPQMLDDQAESVAKMGYHP